MASKSSNKSSNQTADALPFLMAPGDYPFGPVCVVAGDDAYLRHEARVALCKRLLSDGDGELAQETLHGREAELRDVLDALSERSLFGSEQRVVVVEDADPFVKQYRAALEDYLQRPAHDAVLVLDVQTWPGNTRLAKAVAASGLTIRCSVPQKGREASEFTRQVKDWLVHVAQVEYGVKLERPAVELLLEQLPTEVGILYQEVGRLALLALSTGKAAGGGKSIDRQLVADNVGGWRVRKTWDMIDAAAEGRADEALLQLDRLISAGEEPHALLPQMASTLRRFAAAVRLYEQAERRRQRLSLRTALEQAGIPKFKLGQAEQQLRQIRRDRAKQLFEWLLAADLETKGHNSTKDRARRVIETLIVRLSRQVEAPQH